MRHYAFAKREEVLGLMLLDGLKPAGIGLGFGLLAGAATARLIRTMLYGVGPLDPVVFASMTLAVELFSVFSCFLPAWRASRVDPMEALRTE